MEAPPVWVFKAAGLLVGFAIAYFFVFKPKKRPDEQ